VSIVGITENLIWTLRIVPFSQTNIHKNQLTELDRKFYLMMAKERTDDKKERMNEKRKAQLENFKNRKKLKLATDTQQLQG
jgi:hypothetical protein